MIQYLYWALLVVGFVAFFFAIKMYNDEDRSNTTKEFKSEVSSRPPAYKIGEKVEIVYDPKDVDEVKVVSFWGLYRWAIILSCFAAPLLIIGGGYLLYQRG